MHLLGFTIETINRILIESDINLVVSAGNENPQKQCQRELA